MKNEILYLALEAGMLFPLRHGANKSEIPIQSITDPLSNITEEA